MGSAAGLSVAANLLSFRVDPSVWFLVNLVQVAQTTLLFDLDIPENV